MLRSISDQALSRSSLARVIQEFNLYERKRSSGELENAIEQMRRDIDVSIDSGNRSYRIAFVAPDPTIAQRVTQRLAMLFMEVGTAENPSFAVGLKVLPASLPQRPQNQNQRLVILAGAPVGGLLLGLLVTGLLEYRPTTFMCEGDVVEALAIPVLALIPGMEPHDGQPARSVAPLEARARKSKS